MRITLTNQEASILQTILANAINCDTMEKEQSVAYSIIERIINEKYKYASNKQKDAAKKATEKRSANAKKKIENAVKMLRLERKEITTYIVSLESGCSFNTCKKYKHYWEK